ncbi:MAG TPA: amidohydrolase family protein [Acidobacteriaceae bacterium]|nr:amidohydrolase family protein [Acidobacteriaceae bacterium]
MKKVAVSLVLLLALAGCNKPTPKTSASASAATASAPVSGPFTAQELPQFAALDPIDTHTHAFQDAPALYAMLKRLNLHTLDITLVDNFDPELKDLSKERKDAWTVVHHSDGYIAMCSTFDPFKYKEPDFARNANRIINEDFSRGAVAVKIWKNVGMEIKDAKGKYIMPDNPVFEPIFKNIQAHDKTLIAHLADPNTIWEAPNPNSADYGYYTQHPELYMYTKPGAPSKAAILVARDHVLEANPHLRVVGAHLGSMEADFHQLAQHLDKYPNFAVDLAARMPYVEMQPRADLIAFITRYQDRLIYATDNEFGPGNNPQATMKEWENRYANDWRFFATNDVVEYKGHRIQGLALPQPILRKLYHDNAVKWFPGILANAH